MRESIKRFGNTITVNVKDQTMGVLLTKIGKQSKGDG